MPKNSSRKQRDTQRKRGSFKAGGTLDIGRALQQAVKQHKAGHIDKALKIYKNILKIEPTHFDALQLLGAAELDRGNFQASANYIRKAIDERDDLPDLYCNYGIALMNIGKTEEAVTSLENSLSLDNEFWPAHLNIGNLLFLQKNYDGAVIHLKKANQLHPYEMETLGLLTEALALNNQNNEIFGFLEALNMKPDFKSNLLLRAGNALRIVGKREHALTFYERAYQLWPDNREVCLAFAESLEKMNRLNEALEFVQKVIDQQNINEIGIYVIGVRLLRRLKQIDEAKRLADIALNIADQSDRTAALYTELGLLLDSEHKYKPAVEAFRKSNHLMDHHAKALGISYKLIPRLLEQCLAWSEIQKKTTSTLINETANQDYSNSKPIFFCGFPRSGTTLVEKILAIHPSLVTTDEIPALNELAFSIPSLIDGKRPFPECIGKISTDEIRRLKTLYWKKLLSDKAEMDEHIKIIDKMPLNIWFLPLALTLFPQSKILFAIRDPRDACLSCFMQQFSPNESMVHFQDIQRTATLYAMTMQLWEQYKQILPFDFYQYRYEDLVLNPEKLITEISNFIGIEFKKEMLDTESRATGKAISTPSYQTIVKPINKQAVARWKCYQEFLTPVQAILKPFVTLYGYDKSTPTQAI